MKFVVNHSYLFRQPTRAYVCSVFQIWMTIAVEIINIGFICKSSTPVDIIFNFVSLAIIAQFDQYVFKSLRNESFKELVEPDVCSKILVIHHTTSDSCKVTELSTVKDEECDGLRPFKVIFSERGCANKLLYVLYKCVRRFMLSLYFYFFPFIAIFVSLFVPILYKYRL